MQVELLTTLISRVSRVLKRQTAGKNIHTQNQSSKNNVSAVNSLLRACQETEQHIG